MKGDERKAAVRAYKEREITAGIYALRCTASGEAWVGSAPDVSTIENRLRFTLAQGGNPHRALQQAWNAHGAGSFVFEILEMLAEEDSGLARDRVLKNRRAWWIEKLGAARI